MGLTGRTGAGCTTVAKILDKEDITELDIQQCKDYDYKNVEERKTQRITLYKNAWSDEAEFVVQFALNNVIIIYLLPDFQITCVANFKNKEQNISFRYLDIK